jgi:hypothetical protein
MMASNLSQLCSHVIRYRTGVVLEFYAILYIAYIYIYNIYTMEYLKG